MFSKINKRPTKLVCPLKQREKKNMVNAQRIDLVKCHQFFGKCYVLKSSGCSLVFITTVPFIQVVEVVQKVISRGYQTYLRYYLLPNFLLSKRVIVRCNVSCIVSENYFGYLRSYAKQHQYALPAISFWQNLVISINRGLALL